MNQSDPNCNCHRYQNQQSKTLKLIAVLHMLKKLSRDMEYMKKKTQIKLTDMKTKMSEVKNTVDGIIGGLDITKENIGELESIAIETT